MLVPETLRLFRPTLPLYNACLLFGQNFDMHLGGFLPLLPDEKSDKRARVLPR